MKKILLATSMLVGTAGFAAAEVAISGSARMGLLNDFGDGDTGFTSRARVEFTMTGASDTGLEFGAWFRADTADNANQGGGDSNVWVSGAFGKLTMGDVDSAAQVATGGHINGVGLTGLSDRNELSYVGADAAALFGLGFDGLTDDTSGALYEYSANGFGFYLSLSNPSYATDFGGDTLEGQAYGIGVSYAVDAYKFGLGYERTDIDVYNAAGVKLGGADVDAWWLGADAEFGQILVQARYGKGGVDADGLGSVLDSEQFSLGATYTQDALAVTGFVSRQAWDAAATGDNVWKRDSIGLGASYDLGGGASVKGGIVRQKETIGAAPSETDTAADLGLNFAF